MLLLLAEIRCITPKPTLQRRPIGRSFCGWLKNMAGSISILSRLTSTKARLMFIEIIGIPASDAGRTSSSTKESSLLRSSLMSILTALRNSSGKNCPQCGADKTIGNLISEVLPFLKNPQLPVVYLKVNMFLGHVFLLMVCKSIIKNY